MSADIKKSVWMNSAFAGMFLSRHGYIICGVKTTAL